MVCWLLSIRRSQKFSEFSNLNSQKAQIYVSYHLGMTHLLFCLLLFSLFLSCGGFGEIRICVQSDTFNLKSAVLFLSNHWPFDQSIFSSLHFTLPSICLPHGSGCDLLLVCVVDRKVMAGLVVKMARNEGKAEKGGLSSGTTFCAQRGCGCGAHSEDARLDWGWEAAGQQQ